MKALLKKSSATEPYSFSFVNSEGGMVLRSENYKAKDSASKGINAVKKKCLNDKRYILRESTNGMYYFNIKSGNGQVVATSVMYLDVQQRAEAITHLKTLAPDCYVQEQLA